MRVEAVAALVEELFDRVAPASERVPLTAEELADVAARMVRLIETRLQTHRERIEETVSALVAHMAPSEIDLTDATQQRQLALIGDHLALVGRDVLDVKQAVASTTAGPDTAVLDQISTRLEETSARVLEEVDAQLTTRMHRLEALSQSMMTLVGEPLDALADRVQQLGQTRDTSAVLADHIMALRQEGLEREALLRHVVARLDELGHSISPSTV